MPPPLSEAQLLASLTPQEKKFLAWHEKTLAERDSLGVDLVGLRRHYETAWPDERIREQYFARSKKRLNRDLA